MAFASTTIWEMKTTGSDSNGCGFNPANPNMVTDWVVTNANTSSPVISSASYTLISRDVNHWWFAQAGTGLIPGWYKIVSVSAGAGTLAAGIGTSPLYNGASEINTVAGVSASASLSAITGTIDYSQGSPIAFTDLVAATTTTFTSAGTPIGKNFVGNIFKINSGTGWNTTRWECVSVSGTTGTAGNFSSGTTIATASSTGGTGNCGGPVLTFGILCSLINNIGGTQAYCQAGTYTLSSTSANVAGGVGSLTTAGTRTNPNRITGYGSVRGDGASYPRQLIPASGVTGVTMFTIGADYTIVKNLWFDGASKTSIRGIDMTGLSNQVCASQFDNMTNGGIVATAGGKGCYIRDCKFNGHSTAMPCIMVIGASPTNVFGCFFSSSTVAAYETQSPGGVIEDCLIVSCAGGAILNAIGTVARNLSIYASTIYGVFCYTTSDNAVIENCHAEGCSGYGYQLQGANATVLLQNCGGYNNTSGNYHANFSSLMVKNFKSLSGSGYVNTAGSDYRLNNTPSAGALLRAAGYPSYSYGDIGAFQHADPGSRLVGPSALVTPEGIALMLGDFTPGKTIVFDFNTHKADGTPITLAGSPAISIYKNSTTESTSGVTLTVDYDSRTGMHHVVIDTSADGTFYAAGNDFRAVITTGTVDSISVVGTVVGAFSLSNRSALRPATADRTLVVDAAGLADANMVKMGPTGAGVSQSARDIGASVLLSPGTGTGQLDFTSGVVKANLTQILGTAFTESTAGWIANAFKTFFNIGSPTGTVNTIPTVTNLTNAPGNGDFTSTMKASITTAANAATPSVTVSDKTGFSLSSGGIGAIWSYATASITTAGTIGKWILDKLDAAISTRSTYAGADTSGTTTLLSLLTPTRAALLDNLNVGGAVASQADINAINQSASKRILLATVSPYERPESGTVTYTVEARTFDGDGAATNADTAPTLTANGMLSGSLSGNLGSSTNPATGVYRWNYTVSSSDTLEQIRFDVSATIGGSAFTLSCYTQTADFVAANFNTGDRTKLEAIFNKLPTNAIADQTILATSIDALPTNSELATALASSDDATLAAIAALNNVSQSQVQAAAAAALAAYDVATTTNTDGLQGILNKFDNMVEFVSTDWRFRDVALATAPVTPEGPTAAEIRSELDANSTQFAQIVGRTDLIPDSPAAVGSQMALVASAIAPGTLTADAANKIADHVHRRSWSLLEASSDGDTLSKDSSYGAARQIQKSSVSGDTLTIQKTNGTTLGTRTVSTSPTAEPVTGVN